MGYKTEKITGDVRWYRCTMCSHEPAKEIWVGLTGRYFRHFVCEACMRRFRGFYRNL